MTKSNVRRLNRKLVKLEKKGDIASNCAGFRLVSEWDMDRLSARQAKWLTRPVPGELGPIATAIVECDMERIKARDCKNKPIDLFVESSKH